MKNDAQIGTGTWRVFCAVEISPAVRQRVLQHITRLKEATPDAQASWSRAANIHLTLKFLGNIPRTSLLGLSEAAAQAVAGLSPFTIRMEQTGVFPTHGAARVIWIGVNDRGGKLGELYQRLEAASEQAGFSRESRSFHPHLTLARLRQPQHARALAAAHKATEFEPAEMNVSELLVIRSELGSDGSKYSTISRHQLAHG